MLLLAAVSQCGSLTALLPGEPSWSNPVRGLFDLKDRKRECHGKLVFVFIQQVHKFHYGDVHPGYLYVVRLKPRNESSLRTGVWESFSIS